MHVLPIRFEPLDAGFELLCPRRDFLAACCLLLLLLLLLKRGAHPWTLKAGVKPPQGKPNSVIKTRTRTEQGPSLA